MSKKEEKAREYADKEVRRYHQHSGIIEKYGMERARMLSEHEAWELEEAYETGWDEALKNQWINADEQLPNFDDVENISEKKKYLVRTMYVGMGNEFGYAVSYMRSRYKFSVEMDRVKVTHWMPIPPFDEILKDK